jgi:uncharacterized protein (TIGR02147 family)
MANIYDYIDYRRFLRDWLEEKKAANSVFSTRLLAQKIGLKSTGHVSMILNKKANISGSVALKIAAALKLKKRETDFFQYMVLFSQAKKSNDKQIRRKVMEIAEKDQADRVFQFSFQLFPLSKKRSAGKARARK